MKPKANYITPKQFQQIKDYVPELHIRKWLDADVQFAYDVGYWCGCRMGEVPNLTKSNFDWQRKEVFLGRTKTKDNYATIATPFIPVAQEYFDGRPDDEPILRDCKPQNIYKWLIRTGEALNIEALTTPESITGEKTKMHIFRKSIGKDIVAGTHGKRGDLYIAQSQLRHDNPVTTGRYLRLDIEASKEYWD